MFFARNRFRAALYSSSRQQRRPPVSGRGRATSSEKPVALPPVTWISSETSPEDDIDYRLLGVSEDAPLQPSSLPISLFFMPPLAWQCSADRGPAIDPDGTGLHLRGKGVCSGDVLRPHRHSVPVCVVLAIQTASSESSRYHGADQTEDLLAGARHDVVRVGEDRGGNTKNLAPSGRPPGHQPGAFPPTPPSRCSPRIRSYCISVTSVPIVVARSNGSPSACWERHQRGHRRRRSRGSGAPAPVCRPHAPPPPGSRMVPCRPPRLPPRYPSVSSPELRWGG